MKRSSAKNTNIRYVIVGVSFCLICAVFVGVLAFYQSKGTDLPERVDGYVRTYTVPGKRGEIYDCNGKKLVSNKNSYNLVYEYGAMPDTRAEVNRSLLDVLSAIEKTGNGDKLAGDYFILEGSYPDMRFVAEVKSTESDEYYYYEKFLENQKMSKESSAEDVVSYFTGRYKLGTALYTNEEITSLIRIYYEMERVGFGYYQSYTIAKDINTELITLLKESNIEGVNFELGSERTYNYPGYASHILGTLGRITAENKDYYLDKGYSLDAIVGRSGCEEAFEDQLRATNGVMCVEYDENGRFVREYYKVEPTSGKDVYLTIDIELQIAAEDALKANVEMIESSDAGAVTVLDPRSGRTLAIASYPTYDLSRYSNQLYYNSLLGNEAKPLLNRALQGTYAPGSTYKIGAAMAALEQGEITDDTCFNCAMYYSSDKAHTCLDAHGRLDVIGAIRESCNIFFYHLGEAMGIGKMTDYTYALGLGADTGFELGNKRGIVAGPEYREEIGGETWYVGDDLNASIGQSDHGYTPLQLSVYMSSVVNGGKRYNAHILDSVKTFHSADSVEVAKTAVLDSVEVSDETYDLLIEAMRQVVSENPTLRGYFRDVPVTVGGKTGTSQVDNKKDYAVFSGFAPLDDPEIVVSCILEEGVAGVNAGYTAGKVMEKYFELYGGGQALAE